MKSYRGYLIDLDGTVFKGNDVIPEAKIFIKELIKRDLPYVFITNNSSYTAEALIIKLKKMGIKATNENILTSSIATAKYIKSNYANANCFVIGEEGLRQALADQNIKMTKHNVTHVVMGIDREINYEKLATATNFVRQGATFISTNKDFAIPSENGFDPGNGALTSVISLSSGIDPLFIGKPAKSMIKIGLDMLGYTAEEVLLIGDNYLTDIKGGMNSGVDTAFVLTGVNKRTDIEEINQPTYILEDLSHYKFD